MTSEGQRRKVNPKYDGNWAESYSGLLRILEVCLLYVHCKIWVKINLLR